MSDPRYISATFSDLAGMLESSSDWRLRCLYRLSPRGFLGTHQIAHLSGITIARSHKESPMLFHAQPPADTVTIASIDTLQGPAFFKRHKLAPRTLIVFDDAPFLFFNGGKSLISCLSLRRTEHPELAERLLALRGVPLHDPDGLLSASICRILAYRCNPDNEISTCTDSTGEDALLHTLQQLLTKLPDPLPSPPRLRKGERTVFSILEMFFQRMDSRFSNAELARKYGITTVTLHNTFKSLTGMGPQKLFRLLRLNLIHSELLRADPHTATISTIATQWGFPHQGRFSQSYRELFGELPSTTLKKKPSIIGISPDCFSTK